MSTIEGGGFVGSNAGLEFSYSVWVPGSRLTLCQVNFDAEYNHIVDWYKYKDGPVGYIRSLPSSSTEVITRAIYAKPGHSVRISTPFNSVLKYNYIMVENPAQPVDGDTPRTYFYFIRDVEYIAPNTTQLIIQLDVWTTYFRDVDIVSGYLERGHVGIADQVSDPSEWLTVPEGLDYGDMYHSVYSTKVSLGYTAYVVVSTTGLDDEETGNAANPVLTSAKPSTVNNVFSGAAIYYADSAPTLAAWLSSLSRKPWATQGIISISAVPRLKKVQGEEVRPGIYRVSSYDLKWEIDVLPAHDQYTVSGIPVKYRTLRKLETFPYSAIEISPLNGKSLIIKPELLKDKKSLKITIHASIVPGTERLCFYVRDYGGNGKAGSGTDPGLNFDHCGWITDLPQFPTVNNSYLSYMASNRNTIAVGYDSANWAHSRAIAGLNATNTATNIGIGDTVNQTAIGNEARTTQGNIDNAFSAINMGVNAISNGPNIAGAVAGIVGTGAQMLHNNMSVNVANSAANKSTASSVNATQRISDVNSNLARFSADGDREMAIKALNAKVQDAKLLSPTVSGQIGGDGFNIAINKGEWYLYVYVKQILPGPLRALAEYWLRYGYAMNHTWIFKDELSHMSSFTFWKMRDMFVRAKGCPEFYRRTIAGIFERGTTVWRDAKRINDPNIIYSNGPQTTRKLTDV